MIKCNRFFWYAMRTLGILTVTLTLVTGWLIVALRLIPDPSPRQMYFIIYGGCPLALSLGAGLCILFFRRVVVPGCPRCHAPAAHRSPNGLRFYCSRCDWHRENRPVPTDET